jgi:Calx-beta domain
MGRASGAAPAHGGAKQAAPFSALRYSTPYPDSPPTSATGSVSINDVTISEGNSGTKTETFTVTRSGGTAAFDVNFATSNGTATVADSDYVAASNTLHFGANENTKTISVTINGDTKVEANETFNVVLSNATNGATISDSRGIGTIANNDGDTVAPAKPCTPPGFRSRAVAEPRHRRRNRFTRLSCDLDSV